MVTVAVVIAVTTPAVETLAAAGLLEVHVTPLV
jgi:hypothetical protein